VLNGRRKQKLFPDASKKSRREAFQWEKEALEKLKEEEIHMASLTILDWANHYLGYAQQNFSKSTYSEKKSVFKRLGAMLGNIRVETITTPTASKFLQKENAERSGYAANKDRKNLVAAWNWGTRFIEGFPNDGKNPFQEVTKFREERQPRYIPPEADFWKIYNTAEGQDKVMLAAFLYLAARRKEIFNLKWSDVDFENKRVRLWTQKRQGGTREWDWLPMVTALSELLSDWEKQRPVKDTPYVFVCLDDYKFSEPYYGKPFTVRQHFMKRICAKAGVVPFGFHAIRHLSATILYHNGIATSVIQALLRHKSPTTTNTYLKKLGPESYRRDIETVFDPVGLRDESDSEVSEESAVHICCPEDDDCSDLTLTS
jgi:integrase